MALVHILLVEDDEVDAMAVKRGFLELKIANPLYRVRDGIEALDALRGKNGQTAIPSPYIILLDLNMPRMGGLEFLQELRKDPELHRSIVFVMTTSADENDRVQAYEKHVAGYILKQSPGRTFLDALSMLEHFWRVVELPDTL